MIDTWHGPKYASVSEVVFRRCSVKEIFLKNSQENTNAKCLFFDKVAGWEIFKNSLFYRAPPVVTSAAYSPTLGWMNEWMEWVKAKQTKVEYFKYLQLTPIMEEF